MEETAAGVRALGREALVVQTDVTSQEQVQALVDRAVRALPASGYPGG